MKIIDPDDGLPVPLRIRVDVLQQIALNKCLDNITNALQIHQDIKLGKRLVNVTF